MKINIKQEGGFIGMASKAKLDFDKLTEDEQKMLDAIAQKAADEKAEAEKAAAKIAEQAAAKIEEKIEAKIEEKLSDKTDDETPNAQPETLPRDVPTEADFVLPLVPRPMSPVRDAFSYSLSMRKDGKKLDVAFDDTNAPPELVALFQKYIQI
jgi:hypothetical protein